jgi:hypothetical protein
MSATAFRVSNFFRAASRAPDASQVFIPGRQRPQVRFFTAELCKNRRATAAIQLAERHARHVSDATWLHY